MLREIKEGTVLYRREWNIWNSNYMWEFVKVKKITPTGKIRLENGALLNSLEDFGVYDSEAEQVYIQDKIKEHVGSMIVDMGRNIKNIMNEISIEDTIRLGNMLEELNVENVKKWGSESTEKFYKRSLEEFKYLQSNLKR